MVLRFAASRLKRRHPTSVRVCADVQHCSPSQTSLHGNWSGLLRNFEPCATCAPPPAPCLQAAGDGTGSKAFRIVVYSAQSYVLEFLHKPLVDAFGEDNVNFVEARLASFVACAPKFANIVHLPVCARKIPAPPSATSTALHGDPLSVPPPAGQGYR
jgi:hypothetical protein